MQEWNSERWQYEQVKFCSKSWCKVSAGGCVSESELLRLAGVSRTTFWRARERYWPGELAQTRCKGMYPIADARRFLSEHYGVDADAIGQERIEVEP